MGVATKVPGWVAGALGYVFDFFSESAKKIAIFTAYCALLVEFLNGVSDFAMAHFDMSSFMTPTICWFFTQFHVDSLLATYFSLISANWLKSKVVQFWTYNAGSIGKVK